MIFVQEQIKRVFKELDQQSSTVRMKLAGMYSKKKKRGRQLELIIYPPLLGSHLASGSVPVGAVTHAADVVSLKLSRGF